MDENIRNGSSRKVCDMKSSKFFRFILFFSYVVMFIVSLMTCIVSLYLLSSRNIETENTLETYDYQLLRVNPRKNRTTSGVVTLSKRFTEPDEYISYVDDFGRLNIISDFGTEEYECTGSCECDEDERRTTSTILQQGLVAVVMAVTTVIAIKSAEFSFLDNCLKRFKDRCKDTIKATVDHCEKRGKYLEDQEYHCYGKCMANRGFYLNEKIEDSKKYGCESMMNEGDVIISGKMTKIEKIASKEFRDKQLDPFCKKKSERWYYFKSSEAMDGKDIQIMNKEFMCEGGKIHKDYIHCVPKTKQMS